MRKLLIVLLSIMLLIGLSACSSGNNDKFITVHKSSFIVTGYDDDGNSITAPNTETYNINISHIICVYDKKSSNGKIQAYIETESQHQNTIISPDETMEEIMNMIK